MASSVPAVGPSPSPAPTPAPTPSPSPPIPFSDLTNFSPANSAASQQQRAPQISPRLVEVINSCRSKKLLDARRIATEVEKIEDLWKGLFKDAKPGEVVYQRGSKSKERLFRSILGSKESPLLLMSHCEKGGDQPVGTGAYKSVKYCVNLNTGERKVVAVFRKIDPKTKQPVSPYLLSLARREAKMMERCKDIPEVVRLDFSHETDEYIFYVMEDCEQGDLFDMLDRACQSKQYFSERSRLNIALDLAQGLKELHEKGILHRDIKSENVFLFRTPGGFHAKIGDLGLACDQSDEESRLIQTGSPGWLSRESARLFANGSFGKDKQATLAVRTTQDDMDPLGYILYQLFHPRHEHLPFQLTDDLGQNIAAVVKFSNDDLLRSLNKIHRPHRGVLQRLFFQSSTAGKVRTDLEDIQQQPVVAPVLKSRALTVAPGLAAAPVKALPLGASPMTLAVPKAKA